MSCKRSENIRIEYYGSGLPALPGIPDVVNVLLWYSLPIPDEVDQLGNVHTLLWAVHGGKQIVLSCPGQWSVVSQENNKRHLSVIGTYLHQNPLTTSSYSKLFET